MQEVLDTKAGRSGLAARRHYQDRAVDLLRQALDTNSKFKDRESFWKNIVSPDNALRPIRRSPKYQQLASQYLRATK